MATPNNILSEEDISRLTELKVKWPKERIQKESYEQYIPNNETVSRLKFQRWRYEKKMIDEGR